MATYGKKKIKKGNSIENMMVHCMCQFDWVAGCVYEVFLGEMNVQMDKAGVSPWCGWVSSNPLRIRVEQKAKGRICSLCLSASRLRHWACPAPTLGLRRSALLCLRTWTNSPCLASLPGLQRAAADHRILGLHHHMSCFLIVYTCISYWPVFSGEPRLIQSVMGII